MTKNEGGENCLCETCPIWAPDETDVCVHYDEDVCPENIRATQEVK